MFFVTFRSNHKDTLTPACKICWEVSWRVEALVINHYRSTFHQDLRNTRPSVLLCSTKGHNLFVTSTTPHQNSVRSYSSSQPIKNYPMKLPGESCFFSYMDSVHGLICFEDEESKKPLVWNPSMQRLLVLPKPNMSSRRVNMFIGYDSVQGKHKVLCLPYKKTSYVCRVFTLGSGQESWRTVKTNLKHMCRGYTFGRCIKGVIYYLARASNSGSSEMVLMSFDVRSEIFRMIEVPSSIRQDVLISYKGRLACVDLYNQRGLWILEDVDKHKWSFHEFLLPLYMWTLKVSSEEQNLFQLTGCTYDGEFIYVPSQLHKLSYIIFYDPVRNSCRRLKLEGFVDGEFGFKIDVFPNHTESLVPL